MVVCTYGSLVCTYGSLYNIQGWLNGWWNWSRSAGETGLANQAVAGPYLYSTKPMQFILITKCHSVSLCQIGSYPPAAFDLKIT